MKQEKSSITNVIQGHQASLSQQEASDKLVARFPYLYKSRWIKSHDLSESFAVRQRIFIHFSQIICALCNAAMGLFLLKLLIKAF